MLETIKQKLTQRNQQGFTIIEVVLVLAIAGLIFLIVFMAVPQLQRSQRDSQRRSDVGRFMSALETYSSNNNGQYPDPNDQNAVQSFVDDYITTDGSVFDDPLEGPYDLSDTNTDPSGNIGDDDIGKIFYRTGVYCADSEGVLEDGNARHAVAMVPLENGTAYCQDNR